MSVPVILVSMVAPAMMMSIDLFANVVLGLLAIDVNMKLTSANQTLANMEVLVMTPSMLTPAPAHLVTLVVIVKPILTTATADHAGMEALVLTW